MSSGGADTAVEAKALAEAEKAKEPPVSGEALKGPQLKEKIAAILKDADLEQVRLESCLSQNLCFKTFPSFCCFRLQPKKSGFSLRPTSR